MATPRKRHRVLKWILISLFILIVLAGIGFQVFITRYLPPMVRERLADVIVKGSDSLYRFDMGKFKVSFWGGSVHISDLTISIDSARYQRLREKNNLPPITFLLNLQEAKIEGVGVWSLILRKKINVDVISFRQANLDMARHFRNAVDLPQTGEPLWKAIQPDIRSIAVRLVRCDSLNVSYQNVDSASTFFWKFDKCNARIYDILVDSASANDSSRMLFAKNLAISMKNMKMETPDGLYGLGAGSLHYSSAARALDVADFEFKPILSEVQFMRHFGYQHEIYRLKMPAITIRNFDVPQWINFNRLCADSIHLDAPVIKVSMNRNIKPNPYSKKGKYPQQLLQHAPFTIRIRELAANNATVTYDETNNVTGMTGHLAFPNVNGTIRNITNDTMWIAKSDQCVADVHGGVMKTGRLQARFIFNLKDPAGAFSVRSTITNLDAAQLQPLALAMTATDLQSFDMHRLEYSIDGNETVGHGSLRLLYDNMDILLNKVEDDKSLNKRGFLSFLANRLVIYKSNPQNGDDERTANNVAATRESTKSFFNFIWKTLYTCAGEVVLRPIALRKIEKKKARANK